MRIAPIDIAHKTFHRKMMGFDPDEVMDFLRLVAEELEGLIKERNSMREAMLHIGAPVARPERVAELAQRLNGIFRIVRPYTMYIPLYGAQWAMAVCSDKLDPKAVTADEIDRRIEQRKIQDLKFYNGETHEGVFALPNFIRDLVNPPRLKQQARGRRLGVVRAAAK